MTDNPTWYYAKGEEKIGPISSAELKQLAANGTVLPTDNVWRSDWAEWKPASTVKGLCPQKAGPPPLQSPRSPLGPDSLRLATETAENVSRKLWFLDLRFEQFATPRLIGFVFVASLLLLAMIGIGAIGYALFTLPALQALIVGITVVIEIVILAICLRVFLECCLIAFKIADHLSHLRHLEVLTSAVNNSVASSQD
ncbi:MAG: GYF domain-containing protein [Planctomycetaceae bacterium]